MRALLPWILLYYGVVSLIAFGFYAYDKRQARRGGWRVSEAMLHLLSLLGGWPGAFAAQRILRHKWRKASFMIVFWLIVALHLTSWALAAYLSLRRS